MGYFLPRADAELATWVTSFAALVSSTPLAYGISVAQAQEYDELRAEFIELYQRATEPATRTMSAVADKNDAREAVKAKSRELAKIIEAHPGLSDGQRKTLGLTVRKQPSPIPVPATRPCLNIVSSIGRTVIVRMHDSESASKRGKPAGVKGAMIYSFVGAEYPSEPSMWAFQGLATRPKYQIVFPHELPAGAQVWVRAAWINPRLQAGPTSTPISTNLQGGGVNISAIKIAA